MVTATVGLNGLGIFCGENFRVVVSNVIFIISVVKSGTMSGNSRGTAGATKSICQKSLPKKSDKNVASFSLLKCLSEHSPTFWHHVMVIWDIVHSWSLTMTNTLTKSALTTITLTRLRWSWSTLTKSALTIFTFVIPTVLTMVNVDHEDCAIQVNANHINLCYTNCFDHGQHGQFNIFIYLRISFHSFTAGRGLNAR